ncbi:nickel-responsive transcriptional regulator NikR [Psychrobacter phenylpyruvicus]|uniref:Putative nickel-responsive regulator n=1 Tax=Psychrobacter phenylpyruvicus TaxID=29432 RepID=A0A379LIX4_9GAMM|nr:nickel-responsive transcriptional regulator NikR [Psychrobacter phenylpyruvicus]SUD90560.1 Putative nickel-responsive regulator [Psychrobacter phenylpyruvicus]
MQDSNLTRFGVSMEEGLLKKFDKLVALKGYRNRSEAFRDLVRKSIMQHIYEDSEQIIAGSILLFYNHDQRKLVEEMTRIQHEHHDLILATTHFHVSEKNCLELIAVKGKVKAVQELSYELTTLKGVTHGDFSIAPAE